MQTLDLINIDSSDIKYELIQFPDGQPHIRLANALSILDECCIISRYSNPSDYFRIAFSVDALRRSGCINIHLIITYMMGARMDRVMLSGEPLSIKVIADALNILNFRSIKVFDPHSDVTCAVLHQASPISNIELVRKSLEHFREKYSNEVTLIAPDAGAAKKTNKVAEVLGISNIVECSKKRNLKDGKLSGFKVNTETLEGITCFITDDICDGGGTFIGIAKELKNLKADKVVLVVSHGIFSKGYNLENIDYVYTTNSYRELMDLPSNYISFNVKEFCC